MTWKSLALLAGLLAASPALANPRNCLEIQLQDPNAAVDGDYVIEPTPGVVFTVYCAGMAWWSPREYLPLAKTGGDFNFGQYTAGGYAYGSDVRTSFTKIRIDPRTMLVDIGDLTFATSTGSLTHPGGGQFLNAPFAVALGCGAQGLANIDLTGTPFKVRQRFHTHGWYGSGAITVNGVRTELPGGAPVNGLPDAVANGKVVTIEGNGACGSSGPLGINSAHGTWLGPTPGMFALQLVYIGR